MARRQTKPTISKTMYVHFAAITLALTGALAMLADSESLTAIASEAADDRSSPVEAKPLIDKRDESRQAGRWSAETGAFGSATITDPDASGSMATSHEGDVPDGDILRRLGLTQAQWDALPREEQLRLLGELDTRAPTVSSDERRAAAERILEASNARSVE
ncbi:hypothetical protein [Qipengyuania sp. JC766]|uniref:hypothetical protein n=1 Tax=Qipengyuania sp. JC766 TaxID=3232139 RepID=UPI003459E04A